MVTGRPRSVVCEQWPGWILAGLLWSDVVNEHAEVVDNLVGRWSGPIAFAGTLVQEPPIVSFRERTSRMRPSGELGRGRKNVRSLSVVFEGWIGSCGTVGRRRS